MYSSYFPPPLNPRYAGHGYGLFGGGGNIAFTTALPQSVSNCIAKLSRTVYGFDLCNLINLPRDLFLEVDTNPGPQRSVAMSAEYYVVVCGACPGTLVT